MEIVIKTDNPKKLAKDCLDNHLYVKGWNLVKHLETIYYFTNKELKSLNINPYDIAVAYFGKVPVGVMTLSDQYFNTFIKGEYRKKGIGTALYKRMIEITKRDYKNIPMIKGSKGSMEFFDSLKHPTVETGIESLSTKPKYVSW